MRRFLAFVLALTLVLGTLPMSATAASVGPGQRLKDIAGDANEEAIQVCYDLGIVEGTPEGNYEPTKAVNRAEFAALVTRALAIPKSALDSYTSTIFRDTAGYTWAVPYLAFCQQKGIMKGNGYGDAMPGRTINANEAVTMVLRAIGYTDNASVLVGQWPANYVSLAQTFQLYDKVTGENDINKAAAAQIIYNTLTVQMVQVDANALVSRLYDYDPEHRDYSIERNLLTSSLNCAQYGPVVIAYADAGSASINLTPYVGALATLYRSKSTDKYVAITDIKTEFLPGKFTFNNDGTVNKYKLIDGTEYNINSSYRGYVYNATTASGVEDIWMFKNGSDGPGYSEYIDYISKDGQFSDVSMLVLGVKRNGNMITEIHSIAVWDAYSTFLWDSESMNSAKTKIDNVDLPTDDFGEVDHNMYVLEGADSIDAINNDNVVYLFKNRDDEISKLQIGTETHSGKITRLNKDTDFTEVTIGGERFGTSPYFETPGDIDINNEGTVYLDYYNRIFDFKLSEASKGNYAVVMATDVGNWSVGIAKIFDNTGKEVVYDVKDDVRLSTGYTFLNLKNRLAEVSMSGGKISELKLGIRITTGSVITGDVLGKVNKSGTLLSFPNSVSGQTALSIDTGIIVYVQDGDDFSLGSLNDIKDQDLKDPFEYIMNGTKIGAIIIGVGDAGADSIFIMVNGRYRGSDDGGDAIDVVRGLAFKDGSSAVEKEWNYTDALLTRNLQDIAGIPTTDTAIYPYFEMVEFGITDDGVLKKPALIDPTNKDDRRIDNVKYAGTFDAGGGMITISYEVGTGTELIACEGNALLYYLDGDEWKVQRPTKALMRDYTEKDGATFTFLKSDKDNGYDIIIKY